MKKHFINFTICLFLLFLLFSCDDKTYSSTLTLNINQKNIKKDKSILPEDIPLDVTQFTITGQGPNKNDTFKINTSEDKTVIRGINIGEWDLFAVGKNKDGLILVSGETTITITTEATSAIIELDQLVGSGTMSIEYNWNPSLVTNPKLELDLRNQNNEKIIATPTSINYDLGVATFESVAKAGSYILNSKLYDGDVLLAGCVEAIRIVMNKTSSGLICFNLNEENYIETSDEPIILNNHAGIPITCSIADVNEVVPYNQKIYPKIVENNNLPLNELSINWYIDGRLIGSGPNCSISPSLGFHRIDVVIDNGDIGSTSSASKEFEVKLNSPSFLPKVISTINHGDNGYYIGSNMKICYLPDNKILSYCGDTKTLQICRIVNNTIEVLNTYNNSTEIPLSFVNDIKVDYTNNRIFISEQTTNSINIYDYNYNKLNKYFSDNTIHKYSKNFGDIFIRSNDFFVFDQLGDSYREYNIDPKESAIFHVINMVQNPDSIVYHCTKGLMSPNKDAITYFSDTGYVSHAYNTPGYSNCLLRSTFPLIYEPNEALVAGALDWKTFIIGANNRIIIGSLVGEDLNFSTEICEKKTYVSGSYGLPDFENISNFIYYNEYNNLTNKYEISCLYAISEGTNELLAFSVDKENFTLNYIGKEELTNFTPTNGTLSNDNETLILWGQNEQSIKICKIQNN